MDKIKNAYGVLNRLYYNYMENCFANEHIDGIIKEGVKVSEIISYISTLYSINFTIDDLEKVIELINHDKPNMISYKPKPKKKNNIKSENKLHWKVINNCESEISVVMDHYENKINDPEFLNKYFNIHIPNEDDIYKNIGDDDFDYEEPNLENIDFPDSPEEVDDDDIDPLEIRKDRWGNYYSLGDKMFNNSINQRNNDDNDW